MQQSVKVIFIILASVYVVDSFECGNDTCTSQETCVEQSSTKTCYSNDKLDKCSSTRLCILPTTCCNSFNCCPYGTVCADQPGAFFGDCVRGTETTTRGPSHSSSSSSKSNTSTWYYIGISIAALIAISVISCIVCCIRKSRGHQGEVVHAGGNQAVYSTPQSNEMGIPGTTGQTNLAYGTAPVASSQYPVGTAMVYKNGTANLQQTIMTQSDNQNVYHTITPSVNGTTYAAYNPNANPATTTTTQNALPQQQYAYASYNNAGQTA